VVPASPPFRRHLAGEDTPHRSPVVPLIAVGSDKTEPSGLLNRAVQFLQFRAGASGSCLFCMETHFDDSVGDSTSSSTSSMKGGNYGNNKSDLDKGNILKPTFDTLTEEDRKTFEAYRTNLKELFLARYEVMR
jgi:hypothetical protein